MSDQPPSTGNREKPRSSTPFGRKSKILFREKNWQSSGVLGCVLRSTRTFGTGFQLTVSRRDSAPWALPHYHERQLPSGNPDNLRLAVLADALEEAEVAAELVTHLRSPG